jgi:hypothetical protein
LGVDRCGLLPGARNPDRRVLGTHTIPPTNESGLFHFWYDCDDPSVWAAGSVFLDGPDHAEKS